MIAWIKSVTSESPAVTNGMYVEAGPKFPHSGLIDGTACLATAPIPARANPSQTPAITSLLSEPGAGKPILAAISPAARASAAAVKTANTSDTDTISAAVNANGCTVDACDAR